MQSALIDTFFAILELSQSRFSVSQVLGVLETEAVQKRFGFNEPDLDLIRHWIARRTRNGSGAKTFRV